MAKTGTRHISPAPTEHHTVRVLRGRKQSVTYNPGKLADERRVTNDIDVVSEGTTPQLRKAIKRVARENIHLQLEPGWFNAAAKVAAPQFRYHGCHAAVQRVAASSLLGTSKSRTCHETVRCWQGGPTDIPALIKAAGITSRQELYDLVTTAYGPALLLPSTEYVIEQIWEAHASRHFQEPGDDESSGPELALDS